MTWATSNAAVATVSGTGLVSGVAVGSATLTATSEGINGTATVTVSAVPVVERDRHARLGERRGGADCAVDSPRRRTRTAIRSRDASSRGRRARAAVATVNGSGLVTAKAAGSATITATSEGQERDRDRDRHCGTGGLGDREPCVAERRRRADGAADRHSEGCEAAIPLTGRASSRGRDQRCGGGHGVRERTGHGEGGRVSDDRGDGRGAERDRDRHR